MSMDHSAQLIVGLPADDFEAAMPDDVMAQHDDLEDYLYSLAGSEKYDIEMINSGWESNMTHFVGIVVHETSDYKSCVCLSDSARELKSGKPLTDLVRPTQHFFNTTGQIPKVYLSHNVS